MCKCANKYICMYLFYLRYISAPYPHFRMTTHDYLGGFQHLENSNQSSSIFWVIVTTCLQPPPNYFGGVTTWDDQNPALDGRYFGPPRMYQKGTHIFQTCQ